MEAITSAVKRVSTTISEIASAATLQNEGLAQVNSSIGQLDQMTQQNAALVEQSAAAAETLNEQARRLSGVVEVFQLDNEVELMPFGVSELVLRLSDRAPPQA